MRALIPVPTPRRRRSTLLAIVAASAGVALVAGGGATASVAAIVDEPVTYSADSARLTLSPVGSFDTGVFDESAAEIVAFHDDRLFVVNALAGAVDVLDASDPSAPTLLFSLTSEGIANSVAIRDDGLGLIALEAETKTDAGRLVFFDAEADAAQAILGSVTVGALPDMVAISPNGTTAVVANEGEPNDDYTVDPEGSVSVVALPRKVKAATQAAVRTADFHAFEADGATPVDPTVRVFAGIDGDTNPVSRSLEPEYATIDGRVAYVTLQEANALAVVDLRSASITEVRPLGFKDHSIAGSGIDPSDRDPRDASTIDIRTFDGLKGMYQPDAIAAYSSRGHSYLVTANEGDAREWGDYVEGARVKDLEVCATSPLASLTGDEQLGRLTVTTENGFDVANGCYDELYAFGARSFSIWSTTGERVFDSGDGLETITAAAVPEFFNSNHSETNREGRSDDKGPEPEGLAIGKIRGSTYAFVGLERIGGIAVYDITSPEHSEFVTYVNNRDFSVSVEGADDQAASLAAAGDLGPEGVTFIPARESPTGSPMLAVGNEVSGTTTLFAIDVSKRGRK